MSLSTKAGPCHVFSRPRLGTFLVFELDTTTAVVQIKCSLFYIITGAGEGNPGFGGLAVQQTLLVTSQSNFADPERFRAVGA